MFEKLDIIPQDPILSLMMEFQGDNNPNKVDLGVGVYKTPTGETPILASVKTAEEYRWRNEATKSYIGGPGNADFNQLMRELALGKDHKVLAQGRVASI